MVKLLAIESSCDETSAAVLEDGRILSNVVTSQLDHHDYGGVVPELASRLHQQQIIRVVNRALRESGTDKSELSAVAFTRGPGLLGPLLVGTCFAKSFAFGLDIPLIEVNHMQAHVLSNFIEDPKPEFPFLCLTVSGGHTQIIKVNGPLEMELLGETLDDAAGEAFDKAGKLLGLGYPGGPLIDKYAKEGNIEAFKFPEPRIQGFNYSFSGLKTAFLYFLQDRIKEDPDFIEKNLSDICASYQHRIVAILLSKIKKAARKHDIKHVAIAGGVSANSYLRKKFLETAEKNRWTAHIPQFQYCTDNAGMIAMAGYFKYLTGQFTDLTAVPFSREKV